MIVLLMIALLHMFTYRVTSFLYLELSLNIHIRSNTVLIFRNSMRDEAGFDRKLAKTY